MRRGRYTRVVPRPMLPIERERLLDQLEKIVARLRKDTIDSMLVVEERLRDYAGTWLIEVVRTDTGEVVADRPATAEDRTLELPSK